MLRKFFITGFLTILFSQLFSQIITIDYSNPKEYEIGGITVSGIKYLNPEAIISLTGLSVGQKIAVPSDQLSSVIKKLWKQGLFSDIEINVTSIIDNKVYLDIFLLERPRLSKITYFGLRKGEEEDIKEKLKLVPGSQITENVILTSKNIIYRHFADKGFYKTQVDIKVIEDTALQNVADVEIHVNKNKKIKINEITVEGNEIYTDKKIKRILKETKIKRWYGLFKPSKYQQSKYDDDKQLLIEKYNGEGYRDAKIISDTVYYYDKNTLNIVIKIEEGKKYYFRNISWIGNSKYSSKELNSLLDIRKGDVYDLARLDKRLSSDQDAVGNLYMDDGYLFFQSIPREVLIEGDSIDVEILMYEGKQATINKITIVGNTKTNDHVIRREIKTLPGELFRRSDVIRSIRELAQLGNFDPEQLVPNPVPHPEDGTVDIEYSVVEKGNDQVELSGGWGANMVVGTLGLHFNNFSLNNIFRKEAWQPLPSGDGQQLSLRAQTNGDRYQSFNISFYEPWLGGKKPNSFTVSLYYTVQSNGYAKSSSYRKSMNTIGSSIGFGRRLTWPDDYFTLYNELSFQRYNLNGWSFVNQVDNGILNNFNFKTVFSRNSIDNPLYTRTGSSFTLSVQLTPPYSMFKKNVDYSTLSSEEKYKYVEYHKWTFSAEWFSRIVGDLVLRTKAQYGFLGYYNKSLGYSPIETYSLGGDGMGYFSYGTDIIGLRGYENDALTPSKGGNLYNKYTLELRYPLTLKESATIYGLVFGEAGNIWNQFNEYNPFKFYRSAGMGVRIFLPMLGMIGIDWGYGFDDIPGRNSGNKSQFHFVLGQTIY